ncbi:hypothetical protein JR316_0011572 [Psilocybe cubensis]|uniref:Uncharacterized protein n=2 Tax=Psilocybe cubensis TaxID=181762 RepID=A0ACB8GK81_PSICU|nr:hypothetical protein JR316_0011572 [Psilocybe cubensis]KAH9476004.1 hypothetical protein JR316_0011572 [Psilocybe cubensis]
MGTSSLSKLFARPSKRLGVHPMKGNEESNFSSEIFPTADAQQHEESSSSARSEQDLHSVAEKPSPPMSKEEAFEALLAMSESDEDSKRSSVFTTKRTSSGESSPSEYSSSPSTPSSFSLSELSGDSEKKDGENIRFPQSDTESDLAVPSEEKLEPTTLATEVGSKEDVAEDPCSGGHTQDDDYLDMRLVNKLFEDIVNPRARRVGMVPGPRTGLGNAILAAYKQELLETVIALEDSFSSPVPASGLSPYPWDKSPEVSGGDIDAGDSSPDASFDSAVVSLDIFKEKDEVPSQPTTAVLDGEGIKKMASRFSLPPNFRKEEPDPNPLLTVAHILLRREQDKARGIVRISVDGDIHPPDTRVFRTISIRPFAKF